MRPTKATFELVVERDKGRCARCGHEVSGRRGIDFSLHHRRPAGAGGSRQPESHAAGNLVLLHGHGSSGCHGAVESSRAFYLDRGLLVRQGEKPASRPIHHAVHGHVLLDDEGGVTPCASS